ncbi:hypothetical protein [Acidithiobacillus sulfuriphilus]|uniref:hypothetical protein n=1 Tax=Acidithiobacillus sulfuriphilus TaxID=1867749 RepID=UPI003F6366A6
MYSQDQRNVAKTIASAFLVSCLASGAVITVANAETMVNSPAAETQSNTKAGGGTMRHGCNSKSYAQKKSNGMIRHGCSSKTLTQKSGM